MKAKIKLTNLNNQSETIQVYEKTEGEDWVYQTSPDGITSRVGEPPKWVESSNGQAPIEQIINLLDGDVGEKWTHQNNIFELIHKE